jgi:RHS repeat-associated protein
MNVQTSKTYGAYGSDAGTPVRAQTAYAGERCEADTGWYMLGERAYSPVSRRFLAPDGASPFDGGGVNRYAYCSGDPVNRIDPSGHAWLNWLGASLGLGGTASAARGVSPASRVHEAASTPATMSAAAASVSDTVSIASAIDSVALMTADRPEISGVFGWITMGAKTASGGTSLPAARTGSRAERFLGQQQAVTRSGRAGVKAKSNVQVIYDEDIPANRLTTNRFGQTSLKTGWTSGTHSRNPKSSIWAPDTSINEKDFPEIFKVLSEKGTTEVNVYTGAHGVPDGRNWHLRTGERLLAAHRFFLEDLVRTKKAAQSVGIRIKPVNIGLLTKQQMQHHLMKDGVHLIGTCFGSSDEVVMEALNLSRVVVYDFT